MLVFWLLTAFLTTMFADICLKLCPPPLLRRSLYLWAPVPGGELAAATASASTSMPQASSSGAAAGASGGGAGAASALRSSAKFTFFDADPGGKKTAGTKRKGGPGGKGGPADDSDDD